MPLVRKGLSSQLHDVGAGGLLPQEQRVPAPRGRAPGGVPAGAGHNAAGAAAHGGQRAAQRRAGGCSVRSGRSARSEQPARSGPCRHNLGWRGCTANASGSRLYLISRCTCEDRQRSCSRSPCCRWSEHSSGKPPTCRKIAMRRCCMPRAFLARAGRQRTSQKCWRSCGGPSGWRTASCRRGAAATGTGSL